MPEESTSFFSRLRTTLKTTASSTFKYVNEGVGAAIAFPFAVFNAVTTTTGAGIILPLGIGYPIGLLISTAYFVILTSTKVKAQHPLRRLLLILIFAPASAYTSFFSIYQQMNGRPLEQQTLKEIVYSHNKLVDNIDEYLNQIISQSENLLEGQIAERDQLQKEIDKIEKERKESSDEYNKIVEKLALENGSRKDYGLDKGYKGEKAEDIASKKEEKKRLEEKIKKNRPIYSIYQQIKLVQKKYSNELQIKLDEETLLSSPERIKKIFGDDHSLYSRVKGDIYGFLGTISEQKFTIPSFDNYEPLEDNYVKIPIFLVPLNSLLNGSKEARFILIALIIAIGMEVIPILLSGIHIVEQESKEENKIESSTSKKNEKSGQDPKPKKVISQISDIVSSFILDLKELRTRIINSYNESVSSPALYNTRNHISRRLHKAMEASEFQTIEDKKKFLRAFYDKIDHDLKEIEILRQDKDEAEKQKFDLASKLFVDVMHKKAQWLVRHPSWENGDKSEKTNRTIKKAKKKNNDEFIEGKWYFEEQKYQEFLDWWFEAHNHPEKLDKSRETLQAQTKINHEFHIAQSTKSQESESS